MSGLFRAMADSAPVLIWSAGPDSRCTYFNRGWLEFTGRSMEQEIGNGWLEGVHPDDRAGCIDACARAFAARKPLRIEYRLRRADGQYRWLLSTGVPHHGEDGSYHGYIGSCIDISDHRETEALLRAALREREETVERERMLRRELDHRVRNNLASLLGLVRLYRREGDPEHNLDQIEGKIRAMREVHDLATAGDARWVSLPGLLKRLVALLLPEPAAARVEVEAAPGSLAAVRAAPLAIIVQELLANSLRHGSLGVARGNVDVRLSPRPEGAEGFRLSWVERGGPTPSPVGEGVGMALIRGFVTAELQGRCEARFAREGLEVELVAGVPVRWDGGELAVVQTPGLMRGAVS